MSERRSGRSRKQVDYAKFEADNDDDFANPTPPPPKKKKTSEKSEGRREKEKPAKVTSSDKPTGRKERLPLDDKLYERDLQAALEMSLQESESQPDKDEEISRTVKSHAILHSTPLVDADRAPTKTDDPEESQTIMPSAIPHGVTADNNIEFLGTVTCSDSESPPPGKRQAAARSKRKSSTVYDESTDDDEDFGDEESSESDSDFNDADSDFDDGKSKKKVKGKAAPKQSTASAAAEKKHRTATKCNSKAPSAGQAIATPKSAVSSTAQSKAASSVSHRVGTSVSTSGTSKAAVNKLPSAPHKTPVWTPPGHSDSSSSNSGSGAALKSPSSGLRLGLSRHARIKPLHPSLKVS